MKKLNKKESKVILEKLSNMISLININDVDAIKALDIRDDNGNFIKLNAIELGAKLMMVSACNDFVLKQENRNGYTVYELTDDRGFYIEFKLA